MPGVHRRNRGRAGLGGGRAGWVLVPLEYRPCLSCWWYYCCLARGTSGVGVGEISYWAMSLFLFHFLVLEIYGGRDREMRVGGGVRFLEVLQRFRQKVLKEKKRFYINLKTKKQCQHIKGMKR